MRAGVLALEERLRDWDFFSLGKRDVRDERSPGRSSSRSPAPTMVGNSCQDGLCIVEVETRGSGWI